jgi:hypothetical protein
VEHGPIADRPGEVGRESAACSQSLAGRTGIGLMSRYFGLR